MSKAAFKRMMRERSRPLRTPANVVPVTRPAYEPPTDEQLANFACAMANAAVEEIGMAAWAVCLTPAVALYAFAADPRIKEGWLRRHRELQQAWNCRLVRCVD